jgi:hypothetical protein
MLTNMRKCIVVCIGMWWLDATDGICDNSLRFGVDFAVWFENFKDIGVLDIFLQKISSTWCHLVYQLNL